MAWYDEAVFYHIYPLGLAGAPKTNDYGKPEHRLNTLKPWIGHIREIGCNALYIGPLFESVGHGYETTDYKKLDGRLGTNEDLTAFVDECHAQGIRVILDGVFNHTGRDFFAFQDIKKNREGSPYKDWYRNVNFWGNNGYNDGFSYENWGGYDLLVKLNQQNPAVKDYICDVIRFWAREFHIDGIRLDAADVLDFGYMQALRQTANELGEDFWLMGEVIHGDYTRWVNGGTLHSVTNYVLHKALYSGHNDHNFFEVAHTVKRLYEMGGNRPDGLKLYNFVDNHDVERIYTKLTNKAHFLPVHILLYTLPGIPSIYYGSEFGIEGRKERGSDDSLRPALSLGDYEDAKEKNSCTRAVSALGRIRQAVKALSWGDYKELVLTNRQYAFARNHDGETVLVAVNNDDKEADLNLPAGAAPAYRELLSGDTVQAGNGRLQIRIPANSGGIWVPARDDGASEALRGGVMGKPVMPEAKRKEAEDAETARKPETGKQSGAAESTETGRKLETEGKPKAAENAEAGKKSETAEGTETGRKPEKQSETAESAETGRKLEVEGKAKAAENAEAGKKSEAAESLEMARKPETKADGNAEAAENAEAGKKSEVVESSESARKPETGKQSETAESTETDKKPEAKENPAPVRAKTYEEMGIEELQQAILEKMAKNGPITDRMRRDVMENVYHNSLINWVKSFR